MSTGDDNDPSWFSRLGLKAQARVNQRIAKMLDVMGSPARDLLFRQAIDFLYESIYRIEEFEEHVSFVGRGVGATKTTQVRVGNALVESFGVGDEMLLVWRFPPELLRDREMSFIGHWVPSTDGEAGKTVAWTIDYTATNGGSDLSSVTGSMTLAETSYPSVRYETTMTYASGTPSMMIPDDTDRVSMAIRRIDTANNPTGEPMVYDVSVKYWKQRSVISWPL